MGSYPNTNIITIQLTRTLMKINYMIYPTKFNSTEAIVCIYIYNILFNQQFKFDNRTSLWLIVIDKRKIQKICDSQK